jgi:hypothetical protein
VGFNLISGWRWARHGVQPSTGPLGYVLPMVVGVVGGLTVGTNSFAACDLSKYNVSEEGARAEMTV